jgi:hypothetical protein
MRRWWRGGCWCWRRSLCGISLSSAWSARCARGRGGRRSCGADGSCCLAGQACWLSLAVRDAGRLPTAFAMWPAAGQAPSRRGVWSDARRRRRRRRGRERRAWWRCKARQAEEGRATAAAEVEAEAEAEAVGGLVLGWLVAVYSTVMKWWGQSSQRARHWL